MGDEFPGIAFVLAGVDVDDGGVEVGGYRVARAEDCAGFEFSDVDGEFVEEGLVAETKIVYLVLDAGDFFPLSILNLVPEDLED